MTQHSPLHDIVGRQRNGQYVVVGDALQTLCVGDYRIAVLHVLSAAQEVAVTLEIVLAIVVTVAVHRGDNW